MVSRRLEAERRAQAVEELRARPLPDSDGPIPLHVAVAAYGTEARPRLSDLTSQQVQVDDLLDVRDGVHVLREPHPPTGGRPIRLREDIGGAKDLIVRHST